MLHLVYGGTFDPVHEGHLAIARAARDALQCPIWLLPAADPPHRPAPGASAPERLRMLELATLDEPGLHTDARELNREGPSYTVDTLRELRAELGIRAPLALLLGADSFLSLPTWQHWQDIFTLAHLVIAARADSPLHAGLPDTLERACRGRWTDTSETLQHTPCGHLLPLGQALHPASATDIRQSLQGNRREDARLPPAVARHIRAHGLYRRR